jgi:hypothetical protein
LRFLGLHARPLPPPALSVYLALFCRLLDGCGGKGRVERGEAGVVYVDLPAFEAAAAASGPDELPAELARAVLAALEKADGPQLKKQADGPVAGLYDMDEVRLLIRRR